MRRAVALAALAVLVGGPALAGSPSRTDAARDGAAWLAGKQSSSGSFGADRADLVADALVAAIAGYTKTKTVDRAIAYLDKHGAADSDDAAATGRIIAGYVAAGEDTGALEDKLEDQYDATSGRFDTKLDQLFSNLLAANGWIAAHGDLPAAAVAEIKDNACSNGGFGYDYGCARGADVDTTSWAINVLSAAGEKSSSAVRNARAYLLDVQRSDGGFPYADSSKLPTSADSTGLALAAIEAMGEEPTSPAWATSNGDPVRALIKLQTSSGGFASKAGGSANLMSTINAIPGLAGFSYPVTEGLGPPPKATPKPEATASTQATTKPDDRSTDDDDDPKATRAPSRDDPTVASQDGSDRPRAEGSAAPDGGDPVGATGGGPAADDAPDAQSFGAPQTGSDERSSPPRSPLLWGGLGVAGVGAGFGIRWLRSRPR